MKIILLTLFLIFFTSITFASDKNELNLYIWSDYIPDVLLQQFEKETGIHVNYSTYDNNETMYAKLKANPNIGYDIVVPSNYFIDRMRQENMLQPIDKSRLSGFNHLNPALLNKSYDPHNNYSIPYLVTATGIVYNDLYYAPGSITSWNELWDKKYQNQLLMLDDVRELFSIALMVLEYSPDTKDPLQIQAAYKKLKILLPNVKLFNAEAVKAIYIDDDANIGMGWSGDIYLANQANPHVHFVYPKDGFIVTQDSITIPMNAPHTANAYQFINFILRPEIAAKISTYTGYTSPNLAATLYLPASMRHNPILYPSQKVLAQGYFQMDVGDAADTYEKYFEELKLSA